MRHARFARGAGTQRATVLFFQQVWLKWRFQMASPRQKRKVKKVMHEFKRGKLKGGRGRRGKVKSRRQAVAIAMSASGQSRRKRKSSVTRRKAKSGTAARRKTARATSPRRATARRSKARGRKKSGR